jgi:D-alanyl-lipoteichoic acid acyltransferase DltB (MBOAT superfamily)
MARGLAKMLGFDLMVNFRLPYLARSPSDFWRRWHISLSTWLRDYLYISLGGNRGGRTNRNLLITMLLGGLWHGAAWTFVLWGLYHGVLLIAYRELGQRSAWGSTPLAGRLTPWLQIGSMFILTVFGWIIFRANTMETLGWVLANIGPETSPLTQAYAARIVAAAAPLVGVGLWQHHQQNLLSPAAGPWPRVGLTYATLVLAVLLYGARSQAEFIYFQF